MKKLLFIFDTDTPPNTFDVVVAYDAGADHVCIQVLPSDGTSIPMETWQRLAPALLG